MKKIISELEANKKHELSQVGLTPTSDFKGDQDDHDAHHIANALEYEDAIKILNNKDLFNIGARHISISTVGIIDGIKKLQNDIWQIDRTVYLNPFSSKIYFFSSEHIRTILSRSESSAETKLVNLYSNNIEVFQGEMQKFNLNAISDLPSLNYQEVENDNKRNKIKGYAYAYLIAANNSTSKENVQLKNIVNKIINLSSAIVNSVSGYGTQQQNEELKYLLQKLNAYQYNDVKEYLKTILGKRKKTCY